MNIASFDIRFIDLNPTRGREKDKTRPCLVVINKMRIDSTDFVWILPIITRDVLFPTDILLKTKKGLVSGVIDTVQIRAVDLKARQHYYKDELQDNLKKLF